MPMRNLSVFLLVCDVLNDFFSVVLLKMQRYKKKEYEIKKIFDCGGETCNGFA